MTLDNAIQKMKEDEQELKRPEIAIYFDTFEESGVATLEAPRYYKEREKTLDTVRRAWDYFCNGNPARVKSVVRIEVQEHKEIIAKTPIKKAALSA